MTKSYKSAQYESLIKQARSVMEGEPDELANQANIVALLHRTFEFWWTGFYRVVGDELVLGPFQGPVACTRIGHGKGVCGSAWKRKETIVVPNVHQFEGHIACSAESCSEIVVPVIKNGEVTHVLDIDSSTYNTFDHEDKTYLEELVNLI